MKIRWKPLIVCLLIPLAVGALSSFLTREGMEAFALLNQPPLSPPQWLFPVVWTILYLMMGGASYLVWTSAAPRKQVRGALTLYGLQLAVNFLWTLIFFGLGRLGPGLICLLALWVLIVLTMVRFMHISSAAGRLLIPYLLWVTFAGYLNFGVYMLN